MSHFLRVIVKAVQPEKLVVEFADGRTLDWPRTNDDSHLANASVGDELTLTLTHTAQILNDLLNNNDAKIQNP